MVDHTQAERIAELIHPLRVKPGSNVNLARDYDPAYKLHGLTKKKDSARLLQPGSASSPTTRRGSPPRTPTACSCACRRWTRPARTARSAT